MGGPEGPDSWTQWLLRRNRIIGLLLWDENPLDDIEVILDEDKLDLVMKDGVIYKANLGD